MNPPLYVTGNAFVHRMRLQSNLLKLDLQALPHMRNFKRIAVIPFISEWHDQQLKREARDSSTKCVLRKGRGSERKKTYVGEIFANTPSQLECSRRRIIKEKGSRRGLQFHKIGGGICEPMKRATECVKRAKDVGWVVPKINPV